VLAAKEREELLRFPYLQVLEEIERMEARRNELAAQARFLEKEVSFLLPLSGLDLPLSHLRASDETEITLGSLPLGRKDEFTAFVDQSAAWAQVVAEERRTVFVLVIYLKEEKETFEGRLKELDFSPIYLTEPILAKASSGDRVNEIIEKDRREIEEIGKKISDLDKEADQLIGHKEKLSQVYDLLQNERERLASSRLIGQTERVAYLEGWVRSADVPRLRRVLEPYAGDSELYVRPPLPEEDPPVVLENPEPLRPFEVITNLYGLPGRGVIDPTIPLAPFFFIFVGLCVSEAGYGALVAALALLYLKFGRPKGNARMFIKLLFYLGLSNIVLGTLVGGWFGFPIRRLLLIDPLRDPLKFLALSLALGFLQVWIGTLIKFIDCLKKKNLSLAVVKAGWLLLLPSLVFYLLTKSGIAGILALLGACGVVCFHAPSKNPIARFFGGLYGLYGISGYLGDTLSYSRLLALGLSTGVIAMVVNTLAKTALGIPWVGWLAAGLVFIGGHLFNLGISFLGGFVHSMRLQFVEFFTKFFQAGGKPFRPLRMEGKYADFI